jgi:hypothetical protein
VALADTSPADLSVVATSPVTVLPGISSDPETARETQTVPPDAASRLGSLTDAGQPPSAAGRRRSAVAFTLSAPLARAELWARVRGLPDAARISFAIDGRPAGRVLPLAPAPAGFSWVRVDAGRLGAGRHELTVRVDRSAYGGGYELDSARVVAAGARERASAELAAALRVARGRVAYAADLGDALRSVRDPRLFAPVAALGAGRTFWSPLEPRRVGVTPRSGQVTLRLRSTRRYHALLEHRFAAPRDWSDRAYAFVRVRGTGSGAVYTAVLDGDRWHEHSVQVPFRDTSPRWRWVAVPLLRHRAVARHVVSVRIAGDDKSVRGRLSVGGFALSARRRDVRVRVPIPAGAVGRVSAARLTPGEGGGAESVARVPLATLGRHTLLLAPPQDGVARARTARVAFRRTSSTGYTFRVRSRRATTLVLAQSADPRWRLTGVPGARPVRAWGALMGWRLPPGSHRGTIVFGGDRLVRLGALGSAGALVLVLVLLVGMRPARRSAVGAPALETSAGATVPLPRPREAWRLLVFAALGLLALVPLSVIHGPSKAGDALAVAAIALMSLALFLVARERRRCDD